MTAIPEDSRASEALAKANQEAGRALDATLRFLKEATSAGPLDVKVFPNGIELIHLKLEAGITERTRVLVEVKISGPKPSETATVSEPH